jgi:hypothetical protein
MRFSLLEFQPAARPAGYEDIVMKKSHSFAGRWLSIFGLGLRLPFGTGRRRVVQILAVAAGIQTAAAVGPPVNLVSCTGDKSIILHWDQVSDPNLSGYNVYRSSSSTGPFVELNASVLPSAGFCDLTVIDGQTNFYEVTAVDANTGESLPSSVLGAAANAFASNDQFLDYIQEADFDYFWYWANPANGMIPDRSETYSGCSIASVGFGLTAIGIGIDHGWITRSQGVARVTATLNTFLNGPQGPAASGTIGYNGWFYHYLDMNTAVRTANSELSSIDTSFLLAGILYAKQYFNGANAGEAAIRTMASGIFNRVNWNWMAQGSNGISLQWLPTTGFEEANWVGYNEGMIIYLLGLGSATYPLPASAWPQWTTGYVWSTNYGQAYVQFPSMYVHVYNHCWIDFRHITDSYMSNHNSTYFQNSRRASLAQLAFAIANPNSEIGYSSNVWGLNASDGPNGYAVHGITGTAIGGFDDGTISPSAAGGAMAFTPEYSEPTLSYFYTHFRPHLWTAYGFYDAFNQTKQWYDIDELGIDQGPIVIMIENYRTQRPWRLFMQNQEVHTGLQQAGFVPLPFVTPTLQAQPAQNDFLLTWPAQAGGTYQVEYSPNLATWFASPTGEVVATNSTASWTDNGPPATTNAPSSVTQRYYRVFQFGFPQTP